MKGDYRVISDEEWNEYENWLDTEEGIPFVKQWEMVILIDYYTILVRAGNRDYTDLHITDLEIEKFPWMNSVNYES